MIKRTSFALLFLGFVFVSTSFAEAFKLPDTGQTKCYQIVNFWPTEIPCAGTGQDGAYNINPLSYTDNGNGTVTDNNTGLIWQKYENASSYNWFRASGTYAPVYNPSSQNVCGSLNLGGYSDWRLPTKKELMSIVDYSITWPGPTINIAFFPNTQANYYWSSTTNDDLPDQDTELAWNVCFDIGNVGTLSKYDYALYVRCVRGGQ